MAKKKKKLYHVSILYRESNGATTVFSCHVQKIRVNQLGQLKFTDASGFKNRLDSWISYTVET